MAHALSLSRGSVWRRLAHVLASLLLVGTVVSFSASIAEAAAGTSAPATSVTSESSASSPGAPDVSNVPDVPDVPPPTARRTAESVLQQLKRDYLECERMAHRGVLDGTSGMTCSVVYERLKTEGFAGSFEALNRWWQQERPRIAATPR